MLLVAAMSLGLHRVMEYPDTYRRVSMALLKVPDPFAKFKPPKDMHYDDWYPQSAFSRQELLAKTLAAEVGGYMLELGSFIGNSAATWVRALRSVGSDAPVVCIDTWLGDVNMWHWRQKFLGPAGETGQPRLYEQFMLNSIGKNVSSQIIPMRASAIVGLRYIRDQISSGLLPRPRVIYLDAAHMYPETEFEADAAWEVLAPGGYLIGDDYDHYWPEVQQSVNEFVLRKGVSEFEDPAVFAANWPKALKTNDFGRVQLLDAATLGQDAAGPSPLLKQAQWVLRKKSQTAVAGASACKDAACWSSKDAGSSRGSWFSSGPEPLRVRLRCCLNGWAGYVNRSNLGPSTTCDPPKPFLQQNFCSTTNAHCRFKFTCR